jgi:hypothetical protein
MLLAKDTLLLIDSLSNCSYELAVLWDGLSDSETHFSDIPAEHGIVDTINWPKLIKYKTNK